MHEAKNEGKKKGDAFIEGNPQVGLKYAVNPSIGTEALVPASPYLAARKPGP